MAKKKTERVLVISDTQAPFHHKDTIPFLRAVKAKYKPTKIVHIGDVVDFHAVSDYAPNPSGYSPGHELEQSKKFVRELAKIFPELVITLGNHDIRIMKRALKAGIPEGALKSFCEMLGAPKGWSSTDKIEIDDVVYVHGHQIFGGGGNPAFNAVRTRMRNVVSGHRHSLHCIEYYSTDDNLLFGMIVGALIDHNLYAFEYQSAAVRRPVIGCGMVIEGKPQLVTMEMTKHGRWTRKL